MGIGIHGSDGENPRGASNAAVAAAATTSSLERTLDAATDRYSRSPEAQAELRQREEGYAGTPALTVSARCAGELAVPPRRLRWRGREVSDEFQLYAERVARGEELGPYCGQVLARPCVDSPWGVPEPPSPPPARRSVVVGALLAASVWLVSALLVGPRAPTSNIELRSVSGTTGYATAEGPGELGPLSSNAVEPLADLAAREVLSHGSVSRALTSDLASEGTTRAVSSGGRAPRASGSAAPSAAASPVLPTEVGAEPPAVRDVPAAPAPGAVEDFSWLLDDADGAAAEAPARVEPPPVPGSPLLLEAPPF